VIIFILLLNKERNVQECDATEAELIW